MVVVRRSRVVQGTGLTTPTPDLYNLSTPPIVGRPFSLWCTTGGGRVSLNCVGYEGSKSNFVEIRSNRYVRTFHILRTV